MTIVRFANGIGALINGHQHRFASFSLKIASFGSQFASVVLLAGWLSIDSLAAYFSVIAIASLSSQFSNFGFLRYSFRYVVRGVPMEFVVTRSLQISLVGTLVAVPVLLLYSTYVSRSAIWVIVAFLAGVMGQLNNLNRYQLIKNDRLVACQAIEALQPITFLSLLCAQQIFIQYSTLSSNAAFFMYGVSFLLTLILSSRLAGNVSDWLRGIRHLFSSRIKMRRVGRQLKRSIGRSALIGGEAVLSIFWFNLIIFFSDFLLNSTATSALGVFQRLTAVANGFISVTISYRIKDMYTDMFDWPKILLVFKSGCVIGLLSFLGSYFLEITQVKEILIGSNSKFFELVYMINYPIFWGIYIGGLYVFSHLSIAALGRNLNDLRFLSVVLGVSSLLMILCFVFGIVHLDQKYLIPTSILSFATTLFLAAIYLVRGLVISQKSVKQIRSIELG